MSLWAPFLEPERVSEEKRTQSEAQKVAAEAAACWRRKSKGIK